MNRGIGSDTVEGLYNRIGEIVSHHPQKVFIMIGINDIEHYLTTVKFIDYYQKIIYELKKYLPDSKIYVQDILPAKTVDLKAVKAYNNAIRKMCYEKNVHYIGLYNLFVLSAKNEKIDDNLLSKDGMHLNGNGYKIWLDSIRKVI